MTTLIVSAFEPEVAWLREQDLTIETLGIGLVAAATRLSQILQTSHRRVIFTGTCGANHPVGTLVRAQTIHLSDVGELMGDCFFPMRHPIPVQKFLQIPEAVSMDVLSPLAITTSTRASTAIQNRFGDVAENLEAYAVAWVCQQNQVPCEIVLGVSNPIGPTGHEEWLKNHLHVSLHTQQQLAKAIAHVD